MLLAHVNNGIVIEIISIPDGSKLETIFSAQVISNLVACDSTVQPGMSHASGSFGPPPAPDLAALVARLRVSGSLACKAIIEQIYPDSVHESAFQNAASIVGMNAGAAPATDPLKTKFANLASAFGMTSAQFAAALPVMQGASMDLATAQAALAAAISAAKQASDLTAALAAFETEIGAVITEINAVLPAPIVAPDPIKIIGLNI